MDNKKVMAVPRICAYLVIVVCILGIIVGSIFDYSINVVLANKTDIGTFLLPMVLIFPIAYILQLGCVSLRGS
jgi:hypothetical protein